MEATRPKAVTFTESEIEVDGFKMLLQEAGEGHLVVVLDGTTLGLLNLRDALAQSYRVVSLELQAPVDSHSSAELRSASDLANEYRDGVLGTCVYDVVCNHLSRNLISSY